MKRLSAVVLILMIVSAGCSSHYYRVKGDTVNIYLKKPEARTVFFAFSKEGYALHRAIKDSSTTWKVTVPAGAEFKYFYIVDESVFVPSCRLTEKDDFGSVNCIFTPGM